ncbi:MAG: hypothetical protein AABZ61_08620, partial [Bacteroidota bacterium]
MNKIQSPRKDRKNVSQYQVSQKRGFVLIQFASKGQYSIFKALNGKCNTLDLLSELETFLGGGTDFETPLNL